MAGVLTVKATIIKDDDRDMQKILKEIEESEESAVYAGVLQEDQDGGLAMIATALEFGALTGKDHKTVIPARPFMRQAAEAVDRDVQIMSERFHKQIIERQITKRKALEQIGARIVVAIKNQIIILRTPINAPSTLAKKFPKDNPLVDKGILGAAINWVVRGK